MNSISRVEKTSLKKKEVQSSVQIRLFKISQGI